MVPKRFEAKVSSVPPKKQPLPPFITATNKNNQSKQVRSVFLLFFFLKISGSQPLLYLTITFGGL
jgi:hypothetical protein